MKKDITTMVLSSTQDDFNNDVSVVNNLLDSLFALTIKDLYAHSLKLKSELESETPSGRKVIVLKNEIKAIMNYFDSALYRSRFSTPKETWIQWIAKSLSEPKMNINKLVDIACGVQNSKSAMN